MKKVLVTGASGSIGLKVIKYLLSEGKYEITALDLRNKGNQKRLKKYRRRINIIYGDINERPRLYYSSSRSYASYCRFKKRFK